MADRTFQIVQTRPGMAPGGVGDEIMAMGTGVDHGDGTATVTPAPGIPGRTDPDGTVTVQIEDLTSGQGHHGFRTELVYVDQE